MSCYSIGSLGKNGATDRVSNIIVTKAIIKGADNGVRIKSWQVRKKYLLFFSYF